MEKLFREYLRNSDQPHHGVQLAVPAVLSPRKCAFRRQERKTTTQIRPVSLHVIFLMQASGRIMYFIRTGTA